ncbi:MAG: GNAT family protein [Cyanobacteriota bacterium]
MSLIKYRKLTLEDYDAYFEIREKALDQFPEAFLSTNEEEVKSRKVRYAEVINHKFNFIMGAFENNILVAMLGFIKEERIKTPHKGFIWGMFVESKKQNIGIGKNLFDLAVKKAFLIKGLTQINLTVAATNKKAKSLYEKSGFEVYGLEKNALLIDGVFSDHFLMVKFKDN